MLENLEIERWIDVREITSQLLGALPDIFAALLLLVGGWLAVRMTRKPLHAALRRTDVDPALNRLLVDNLYKYLVMGLAAIMAAGQLGLNVGAALGTLGIAGIALGFAAKDSLANTIAGFMIFWDKPFRVGHYVTAGEEELYGRVVAITMRTTRIRTPANTFVIIPNQDVIDEALVNHSMSGDTRVELMVGIAYEESVDAAREILLAAVADIEGVLDDPAPAVVLKELGASSVDLGVRVWVADAADERSVQYRCLEACKRALDEAEIEIPYPHLQLFVDNVEEPVWERISALPWLGGDGDEEPETAERRAQGGA